jgi:hypothetical protein
VNFARTEFSEVGKLRRVGILMVWQGFRISAIPPLPSHQLSQKPESMVVLKTIALCCAQTISTQRTQEHTNAAREQERRDLRRGRCNRRLAGEALLSIDPGQRGVVLTSASVSQRTVSRPSTDGLENAKEVCNA